MTTSLFPKQIPITLQIKFLSMLGQLLAEGFSMKDALGFLEILLKDEGAWIKEVSLCLAEGRGLDAALKALDFPDWITSQIYFAHQQGKIAEALQSCGQQLQSERDREKDLQSLLSYPIFLIFFMVGMLFAMRLFLLPQMKSMVDAEAGLAQLAILFIQYSPHLIILSALLLLSSICFLKIYQKRQSVLKTADLLTSFPIIGSLFIQFYSYRFAKEWSSLLNSGLSMQTIVSIMQEDQTTLMMQEIGQILEVGLLEGKTLSEIIKQFSFFNDEFSAIVMHGQKIGSLADSLDLYAQQCLAQLNERVQKLFRYIQPVLFIIIALLIVIIYGSMLLPMFSFMDQL
ncbi:MAG: competence type IV pilus assembly protein ComGB [Atopococcus tabaci]|uniref:Competence type IV pilus assembly protein ComGB n=1 Tax=Atopococcus tabaci TaxID=269774 RepID=A0AA43RK75_9LACT|nr:competence type IV pilus assembly protein ComGB [Atopococcus tabaci]